MNTTFTEIAIYIFKSMPHPVVTNDLRESVCANLRTKQLDYLDS